MATDESQFQSQFRKSLKAHYTDAVVWTNNDMFRIGLPDFSVAWHGKFFSIEAKFIRELPKRKASQALKHEVSPAQAEFMSKIRASGNCAGVLIGLKDVAVFMPEIKTNYTLEEVLAGHRISRIGSEWGVPGFLELVMRLS